MSQHLQAFVWCPGAQVVWLYSPSIPSLWIKASIEGRGKNTRFYVPGLQLKENWSRAIWMGNSSRQILTWKQNAFWKWELSDNSVAASGGSAVEAAGMITSWDSIKYHQCFLNLKYEGVTWDCPNVDADPEHLHFSLMVPTCWLIEDHTYLTPRLFGYRVPRTGLSHISQKKKNSQKPTYDSSKLRTTE